MERFFSSPIKICLWALLVWIFLVSIINNSFNTHLSAYLSCFCIIINFCSVEKTYIKKLLNLFIVVMLVSSILTILDSNADFMFGFYRESERFAGFFLNKNHMGYVVTLSTLLSIGFYLIENNFKCKFFYFSSFSIFALYLFLNGSMGPIVAVLSMLFLYFIYNWIINKKFPLHLCLIILLFLGIATMVEFIPLLADFRGNQYGFYTECIAIFDNLFGTNLLSKVGVESVPGADGWNRKELIQNAISKIMNNPLFGYGSGCGYQYRPHNELLFITLDFGIVGGLFYIANICMILFVAFKKPRKDFDSILTFALLGYLVSGIVGNITDHSFIYFIMICSLLMNKNSKLNFKK